MMGALRVGLVKPEEAIAAAASRGVVLPDIYYGQMQGIERAYSFSIAGIGKLDQLQRALDSLAKALTEGQTFGQWQSQALKAPDVLALPRHRLDNIFRTNIQGAYARGKCVHIQENRTTRPYLVYSSINDDRTRPAHRAMNGHIALVSDPVWKSWMPPCGYRCRCTVVSLNAEQAEQRMQRDAKRQSEDQAARDARLVALMNGPDTGWDYSPCDARPDGLPVTLARLFAEKRPRYSPILAGLLDGLMLAAIAAFVEAIKEDEDDDEAEQ